MSQGNKGSWKVWLLGALGAAGFVVSGSVFALGLGVPGEERETNFYYSVQGTKLYRFLCPDGVVPTAETCTEKDPSFLVGYSTLRDLISQELKDLLAQTAIDIKKEVSALKEADPQVQQMRKTIREELEAVGKLEASRGKLLQKFELIQKNLLTVKGELKALVAKLTTDLPQEELLRSVEVHTERTKQKAQFETDLKATQASVDQLDVDTEAANQKVTVASVSLGKLLPTLVVQSPKLIDLQQSKVLLEAQAELLPELDKRLTDPVAYPLHTWIDMGPPGVKELVDRFTSHALSMTKGGVISRRVIK